jgi:Lipopolysaccharide-assembly
MPRTFPLFCLLASIWAIAGCSHYRLGTGSTPGFSRLYIAPVTTETLLPQAQALLTTQLREAFIKDGRVALVATPAEADAVLRLTLTGYRRDVAVSQPTDTKLARRFDLSLQARATLTIANGTKPGFSDRAFLAQRGSFQDDGQQQSEFQTLPHLAESLAQEVLHAALDTW